MKPPSAIALFDMDDTLVGANTAALYFADRRRHGEISRRQAWQIGWAWIGYRLNAVDMARLIRQGAASAAGGLETEMADNCRHLYESQVRPRILAEATACVRAHQAAGDAVAIVTASTPYIARQLAADLGIAALMSTELEVGPNGRFTGAVVGEPCFGAEKVTRARAFAERHGLGLAQTHFYSDSHSDMPLLLAVGHPHAVRPDFRLRMAAQRRGWPILHWQN